MPLQKFRSGIDTPIGLLGVLLLATAVKATIAAGVLTVTQGAHTVEVQGAVDASDDLVTITGGTTDGFLVLRPFSDARSIVLKHGTGNIECQGAVDLTLAEDDDVAILYKTGTKWAVVASKTKAGIVAATATLAAQATKVAATSLFMSSELTGTGAEQVIPHGLSSAPTKGWWAVSKGHDGAGAVGDKYPDIGFTQLPDATNIYLSCTAGAKFYAHALLSA